MCNPIAGAAVMGGAALGQGLMADSAQREQRRFEKQRFKRAIVDENRESFEQYAALQERDVQETAAAAESMKQAAVAASQARAAVVTAAADNGVAGNTVQALVDEVTAGESEYVQGIVRSRVWGQNQLQRQAESIRGQTYQRILGVLPRTPEPNPLNLFFNTMAGVAGGASMGASFK